MVSDLLPNLAELADEMCFIHSMTAKSNTHGPAENQMSTGFTLDGFPGLGAWGVTREAIPALVADARGSSMRTNPIVLTDDELAAVLGAAI